MEFRHKGFSKQAAVIAIDRFLCRDIYFTDTILILWRLYISLLTTWHNTISFFIITGHTFEFAHRIIYERQALEEPCIQRYGSIWKSAFNFLDSLDMTSMSPRKVSRVKLIRHQMACILIRQCYRVHQTLHVMGHFNQIQQLLLTGSVSKL